MDEKLGEIAYKAFIHSEAYTRMLAHVMGRVPAPPPWKGLTQIEQQAWIDTAKAVKTALVIEQGA